MYVFNFEQYLDLGEAAAFEKSLNGISKTELDLLKSNFANFPTLVSAYLNPFEKIITGSVPNYCNLKFFCENKELTKKLFKNNIFRLILQKMVMNGNIDGGSISRKGRKVRRSRKTSRKVRRNRKTSRKVRRSRRKSRK